MKKFWNWKSRKIRDQDSGKESVERVLFLNGTIAEESWYDDEVTPALFKEELMAGNETVELTVKGTREKTEEILRNISYIQKSEVKKAEPDTVNVILQAETGKDIRENVFFAFAEKKTPILRMETRKVSLEDVFLELTQGEAQELEDKKEGKSDESNL